MAEETKTEETGAAPTEVATQQKVYRINRNQWLRGEGGARSALLRSEDQKRCCLGQILGDAGVPDDCLVGFQTPSQVQNNGHDLPKELRWLLGYPEVNFFYNSEITNALMSRNDASGSDFIREETLIEWFAKAGVKVEFYNPRIIMSRSKFGTMVIDALKAANVDVIVID